MAAKSNGETLVFPFQHDGNDGPGIIAGTAMRPEPDKFPLAIAVNVHQHLKMNSVAAPCLTTGQPEHPQHIPHTASE